MNGPMVAQNCGGFTEVKKICDMAHAHDVSVRPVSTPATSLTLCLFLCGDIPQIRLGLLNLLNVPH